MPRVRRHGDMEAVYYINGLEPDIAPLLPLPVFVDYKKQSSFKNKEY